jgi:hypothetical protein
VGSITERAVLPSAARAVAVLAACLVVSVLAAAADARRRAHPASALYNFSHQCLTPHPSGYAALSRDGDPYEFLATNATRGRARGLLAVVRSRHIFTTWERDFTVLGHAARVLGPGGGRPFEIFVAPHSSAFFSRTGSDGPDVRLCDRRGNADPEHDAIIVADNLAAEPSPSGPIDWSANVLAHELFHAFQGGEMGHFPTAAHGGWRRRPNGAGTTSSARRGRGSRSSIRACSSTRTSPSTP